MTFCNFCGRQHSGTACPPQQMYQLNPLHEHLSVEDLLSVVRSQSRHIKELEKIIEDSPAKIVEAPVDSDVDELVSMRQLVSEILAHVREGNPICDWRADVDEARRIISNYVMSIEFIKSAVNRK